MKSYFCSYVKKRIVVSLACCVVALSGGFESFAKGHEHLRPEIKPEQNPMDRVDVFINFNIIPGKEEIKLIRTAGGYDFFNDNNDPTDHYRHGTYVSGIILKTAVATRRSAQPLDPLCFRQKPRLTWRVSLRFCLNPIVSSGCTTHPLSTAVFRIIAAIEWSIEHDVDILNLSLAWISHPGVSVEAAFNLAYSTGIVTVAVVGNLGDWHPGEDNIGYPARFESVIAIGSVGSDEEWSNFSCTGSVYVVAQGDAVRSTDLDGEYTSGAETSATSPHVAGLAALMISAGVEDKNNDGFINDDIFVAIRDSAKDLGEAGWDRYFGHGLI